MPLQAKSWPFRPAFSTTRETKVALMVLLWVLLLAVKKLMKLSSDSTLGSNPKSVKKFWKEMNVPIKEPACRPNDVLPSWLTVRAYDTIDVERYLSGWPRQTTSGTKALWILLPFVHEAVLGLVFVRKAPDASPIEGPDNRIALAVEIDWPLIWLTGFSATLKPWTKPSSRCPPKTLINEDKYKKGSVMPCSGGPAYNERKSSWADGLNCSDNALHHIAKTLVCGFHWMFLK